MTAPPDTSSLLFAHRHAKLSRAHVERFASELALRAGTRAAALGYCGNVGRILGNVFLHEGQMVMRPLAVAAQVAPEQAGDARADVAEIDMGRIDDEQRLAVRRIGGIGRRGRRITRSKTA